MNCSDSSDSSDDDDDSSCKIISENEENQLSDLRQMALSSMIKKEEVLSEDEINVITSVEDEIDRKLIECRQEISQGKKTIKFSLNNIISELEIDKKATFLNNQKRSIKNDIEINNDIKKFKSNEIKDLIRSPFRLIEEIDLKEDLPKEMELKKKLSDIYKNKTKSNILNFAENISDFNENKNSSLIIMNNDLINSDGRLQKYSCNIKDNEESIHEISKSIDALTKSIHEKLQKSKIITSQIENLKRHKSDLHKDINLTRSKILDLNKVKKQRLATLAKFKILKKKYELSPISSNIDKIETSSTISNETDDSQSSIFDCNQIICPSWINDSCLNQHCGYQHPKVFVKPVTKKKSEIKENDKVFLQEMNPLELLTILHCEACSSRVLISNFHIVDDWHCKSCCEQIMVLTKPMLILQQLMNILHHLYKRHILIQNVIVENRDESVFKSLIKCTDALKAKIISIEDMSLDMLRMSVRHVLFALSITNRVDDAVNFLKVMNYDVDLVLFTVTLTLPVPVVHRLLIDVIDLKISNVTLNGIDLLINRYCEWSAYVQQSTVNNLLRWLELSIKLNVNKSWNEALYTLTILVLCEIIGTNNSHNLNLSSFDLQCDEKFWLNRKNLIWKIIELYSHFEDTNSTLYLVLYKYWILALFYTDNEENAIELCESFSNKHFYFKILLSKLSLNYNYQIMIQDDCYTDFVEHNYNKSEWLLLNRSEKSCVKILENIINKMYIVDSSVDILQYYEHFLRLEKTYHLVTSNANIKISESDVKLIRETSSIWMCYVNLSILRGKIENLTNLIIANCLRDLSPQHLCRIIQLILRHFSTIYGGDGYSEKIKYTLFTIEKHIHFNEFLVLVNSIAFDKLYTHQLSIWLFLTDFCIANFSIEDKAVFFVEMSLKLRSDDTSMTNYDILTHITLCYQVNVEKVWLNLIELILNLNLPLYTLIDVCRSAVNYVRGSLSLWRQYYKCALKMEDQQLIAEVKESAMKIGFGL